MLNTKQSFILGISFIVGIVLATYMLSESVMKYKSFERTVVVKGLAEKEVNADVVIWPITYIQSDNSLEELYTNLEHDTRKIIRFLEENDFSAQEMSGDDISISVASVTDKLAQSYSGKQNIPFRYSASQTVTLYTSKMLKVKMAMKSISELGRKGITFKANYYENRPEYKYTKLNEIKPSMIEESTRNARASAQKFAEDSQSKLGKIKSARQGQFSVYDRDKNTPDIKKVRVVSTIEYYLSD